jgi:hypothetical protein
MGSLKPVVIRSLVAPPNGSLAANKGSLAVKITDQAGNPTAGLPLNLGSPANISDTTDSSGCAVFGGITAGNYQLTFSQAGFVDVGGDNAVDRTVSVTASTTTTETIEYAQAGVIDVSFDTKVGGNPVEASQAQTLTVSHSNMPAPGRKTFDPAGGAQSTISATSLFPFTSGYNVYAGSCPNNDPSVYDSNYFTTNPGSVVVAPGSTNAVTVRTPGIRIRTRRGGSNTPNMYTLVKLTSSGCSETFPAQNSDASFGLPAPGFPFGTYQVCVDSRNQTSTERRATVTGIQNFDKNGTNQITIDVPTSGFSSLGRCS